MRSVAGVVLALMAPLAAAQAPLKATQVAELAEGLAEPHDAAFSPDGRLLFVTDMGNSLVRVLDAMSLRLLSTFGAGELSRPHDAIFDRAGRLLVADTGNDRIAIYQVRGAEAKLVGEMKGVSGPEGVAVAADGRVIVTNTSAGTLAVLRDGRLERTVGRRGSGPGEFSRPHDVEIGNGGTVYVVDSGNDRVQVLGPDLEYRGSFGPALKLDGPKYLHLDGDHIWLADEDNHRILLLDRAHRVRGVLGTARRGRGANAFYKPEAVLARAPYVWVIDTYNDRVLLLRVEIPRNR